jgi:hypothetical protein
MRIFCVQLAALVLALAVIPTARSQSAPPTDGSKALTLQAELLKTIDASHVKKGDEVSAKTDTALEVEGAKFSPGAIVLGHVVEAAPDRLVLAFDHIALKKETPLPLGLSLRAVMMPHGATPQPNFQSNDQISPRAQGDTHGTGVDPATQYPGGRGDMLRSPEAAAQDSANTVFTGQRPPTQGQSVETRSGGVIGLPGVHLTVSSDPKAGATLADDNNRKLKLEKGLLLIFVVSQ